MGNLVDEQMTVPLTEMKTGKEMSTLGVRWRKGEEITSSDVDMLKSRYSFSRPLDISVAFKIT